jgi:hypothetical protein
MLFEIYTHFYDMIDYRKKAHFLVQSRGFFILESEMAKELQVS